MLRLGSAGDEVVRLQQMLQAAGFNPGPIDGAFGSQTRAALLRFQQARGLEVDGVAGPQTMAALTGQPSEQDAAQADPDASVEDLIREQYPTMVWALEHPELGPLLREAAEGEWDLVKLQGELQGTDWWQQTSASARQVAILKETDPAEYERQLLEARSRVDMLVRDLGFTVDESVLEELAVDTLVLSLTAEQLRSALQAKSSIDLGEIEQGEVGGLVQASKRDIEKMSNDYLLDLSDADLTMWIDRITAGTHTIESFQEYAEAMAVTQMPFLEGFVSKGLTPAEALAPYAGRVAQVLEILPEQVDFRNPRYQSVLRVSEGGEQRLATLSEMNQNVRKTFTREWDQTNNAKQSATQVATQIASMFGRRA